MDVSKLTRTIRKSLDWLLYTKEELHLRERDIAMDKLRLKKTVTSADIMRADFGTDCPNGLDIPAYPSHQCRLVNLKTLAGFQDWSPEEQERELSRVGGRAGVDDRIYLNPKHLAKNPSENIFGRKAQHTFANLMSHEHTHRLQGVQRDLGLPTAMKQSNMSELLSPVEAKGLVGKSRRLYQEFNEKALDKKAEKQYDFKVGDYFAKEEEIQARMNEVLAQGYAGWQRMPVTKTELQAAFINLGLPCPEKIRQGIEAQEQGRQALKDFRCSSAMRHQVRSEIFEIDLAQQYTSFEDRKTAFWDRALPGMYGELLELWGDVQGRARMGLDTSYLPAKKLLLAVKDDAVPLESLQQMVDELPPALADRVLHGINEMAAGNNKARRDMVIDALFARDETREALLASDTADLGNPSSAVPGWWGAFISGNTGLLDRYMDAGLDISRSVTYQGKGQSCQVNIFEFVQRMADTTDMLEGRKKPRKELKHMFDDAAARQNFKNVQVRHGITLQHIARYIDDPDKKMTFTDGQKQDTASMNDILALAGLPPVERQGATPETQGRQSSSHFASHL